MQTAANRVGVWVAAERLKNRLQHRHKSPLMAEDVSAGRDLCAREVIRIGVLFRTAPVIQARQSGPTRWLAPSRRSAFRTGWGAALAFPGPAQRPAGGKMSTPIKAVEFTARDFHLKSSGPEIFGNLKMPEPFFRLTIHTRSGAFGETRASATHEIKSILGRAAHAIASGVPIDKTEQRELKASDGVVVGSFDLLNDGRR